MSLSVKEYFQDIGSMDEIIKMAGHVKPVSHKVNSHIHLPPNFSAFESTSQAVKLAAAEGVSILGVSNYYDFNVYNDFAAMVRASKIFPLFGLEIIAKLDDLAKAGQRINDPGNPGKMYICGKGITQFESPNARAAELLKTIRQNDRARMAEMIEKLNTIFSAAGLAIKLIENEIIEMVATRCGCRRETVTLQERHLAWAFQEALFKVISQENRKEKLAEIFGSAPQKCDDAVAVQNDLRSALLKAGKKAFVAESFLTFEQAIELILNLGGIPCYPILADGAKPICEFETPVESLIQHLKERNIHCVELIPIRNKPEVLREYVTKLDAAGFVIVAGTEHNTLDLLAMEPLCVAKAAISEDLREIFRRGAYVVAAHQYLNAAGKDGFVDRAGKLTGSYSWANERINYFANIGKAVISRF